MKCRDCGGRSTGPLCSGCARVVEALGYSVDERLAMLGEPTLLEKLTELGVEVTFHRTPKGKIW